MNMGGHFLCDSGMAAHEHFDLSQRSSRLWHFCRSGSGSTAPAIQVGAVQEGLAGVMRVVAAGQTGDPPEAVGPQAEMLVLRAGLDPVTPASGGGLVGASVAVVGVDQVSEVPSYCCDRACHIRMQCSREQPWHSASRCRVSSLWSFMRDILCNSAAVVHGPESHH